MALCLLKIEKYINLDKANGLHKIGISRKVCLLPYAPPLCVLDGLVAHKTLAIEAPSHEFSNALGLKASSFECAQHVKTRLREIDDPDQTRKIPKYFFSIRSVFHGARHVHLAVDAGRTGQKTRGVGALTSPNGTLARLPPLVNPWGCVDFLSPPCGIGLLTLFHGLPEGPSEAEKSENKVYVTMVLFYFATYSVAYTFSWLGYIHFVFGWRGRPRGSGPWGQVKVLGA